MNILGVAHGLHVGYATNAGPASFWCLQGNPASRVRSGNSVACNRVEDAVDGSCALSMQVLLQGPCIGFVRCFLVGIKPILLTPKITVQEVSDDVQLLVDHSFETRSRAI